jgi:NitT/TauT family transport system substrate-binding protein
MWMAEELGLFKKYNLEAQLIYIPSSATSVQALSGGSVDVITPGSSGVVIAAARGVPVVAVAASTRRAPFTLFTQPEITKPEDLKGKVTGVTRFNSTTHMMTVLICASSIWRILFPCARWVTYPPCTTLLSKSSSPAW